MPNYTYDLPENYYFGGGGDTFATPMAVVILLLAIILILALPRKYAFVPFLLAGLLIPQSVTFVISGLNIYASRLLLLAGLTRLLVRKERYPDTLNSLDKVFIFFILVESIAYVILWRQAGALINRAGFLFTTIGIYVFLRSLIRSKEDVIRVIKVFAFVVIFIAPFMWYEHITQHNPFSWVGASELSNLRNNRVRAQGPFAHAIIAGTFGVVLVPLFIGLWWNRSFSWFIATAAIGSSIVMMVSSSSSTPVASLPAGILAISMWPLRKKMRMVRWGIVIMLIFIQLVMKAPIWFLIDRVSGVLGGSGWHRAMLIDNFVRHFFDWFLIGTNDNPNWGWSMWDVDNAFVGAGLGGGLLGFILFLGIYVTGYRMIGSARSAAEDSLRDTRLIWAIGAALFANTIASFGIVYFDQSIIAWYALLVMISVVTTSAVEDRNAQPEFAEADIEPTAWTA